LSEVKEAALQILLEASTVEVLEAVVLAEAEVPLIFVWEVQH